MERYQLGRTGGKWVGRIGSLIVAFGVAALVFFLCFGIGIYFRIHTHHWGGFWGMMLMAVVLDTILVLAAVSVGGRLGARAGGYGQRRLEQVIDDTVSNSERTTHYYPTEGGGHRIVSQGADGTTETRSGNDAAFLDHGGHPVIDAEVVEEPRTRDSH